MIKVNVLNMAVLLFFVLMQFLWTFGHAQVRGGGSYAYSDSTGNRYSGSYGLKDGKVVSTSGDRLAGFSDTALPGYGYGFDYGYQGDQFIPTFFSNFENLIQEAFRSNIQNQRLAYHAARKAFDLSSNQAGYYPNFATRFSQPSFPDYGGYRSGFGGFPNFPNFEMPNYSNGGYSNGGYSNGGYPNNAYPNSAFAGAAVGPGYRRQIAAINPANPHSPNVNINRINHYSDTAGGKGGYVSVSSRSFASSSNVNGEENNHRGAETIVDDNGKITKYKVEN